MVYSTEGGPGEQEIVTYRPLVSYDFCEKNFKLCDASTFMPDLAAACADSTVKVEDFDKDILCTGTVKSTDFDAVCNNDKYRDMICWQGYADIANLCYAPETDKTDFKATFGIDLQPVCDSRKIVEVIKEEVFEYEFVPAIFVDEFCN